MFWDASAFKGYNVDATDGHVGKVSDLLFDDVEWTIRWLVVDVGHWITGRKILLPLSVFGHPERVARHFPVELTKQQIQDGPDVDTEQPVSRQLEANLYNYYKWVGLPDCAFRPFGTANPDPDDADLVDPGQDMEPDAPGDPNLRGIAEITGYPLHATDGTIGHVENFLLTDDGWEITYLVVNTRNWWPGERVLVSPRSVLGLDWKDRSIRLGIDREAIRTGPRYDPQMTTTGEVDAANS